MECRELFLLNIYMLYSVFSDYMLRGWGRFDPPVKVGGCGRAFWTTPTLWTVLLSRRDSLWAEVDYRIRNIGRIWVENRARSHLLYMEMENVE